MSRQHDLREARIAASYRKAYVEPLSEDETQMLDAAERATLTSLVESSERFSTRLVGANGTQPGVDLDDSAGLRDLMDDLS